MVSLQLLALIWYANTVETMHVERGRRKLKLVIVACITVGGSAIWIFPTTSITKKLIIRLGLKLKFWKIEKVVNKGAFRPIKIYGEVSIYKENMRI